MQVKHTFLLVFVLSLVWCGVLFANLLTPNVASNNIFGALIAGEATFFRFSRTNFRASASLVPALSDPGHVAFICGTGCIVHVGGTLSSQGEVIVGPTFRF